MSGTIMAQRSDFADQRSFRVTASEIYKWRHQIENFFCKLKEFKRIAMRADKTIRVSPLISFSQRPCRTGWKATLFRSRQARVSPHYATWSATLAGISTDTAMVHLADAFHVPCLAFFPTHRPEWRVREYPLCMSAALRTGIPLGAEFARDANDHALACSGMPPLASASPARGPVNERSGRRLDVRVEAEEVVRVVLLLQGGQPLVVGAVGGRNALLIILAEIVHVDAAGEGI